MVVRRRSGCVVTNLQDGGVLPPCRNSPPPLWIDSACTSKGSIWPPSSAADGALETTSANLAMYLESEFLMGMSSKILISCLKRLRLTTWEQMFQPSCYAGRPLKPPLSLGLGSLNWTPLHVDLPDRIAMPHAIELSGESWAPDLGKVHPSVDPVPLLWMHTLQTKPLSNLLKSCQKPEWATARIGTKSSPGLVKPSRR